MSNKTLNIIFFEDYFVASIQPSNDKSFKFLKVGNSHKHLLYFYLNNDGETVRNDEYSKERFENNDKLAYGDFYNLIQTDSVFKNFDIDVPIIDLINDSLNNIKDLFYKELSIKSDEVIKSNITFIPSIGEAPKKLVLKKLKESNFEIQNNVQYFEAFTFSLKNMGVFNEKISYSLIDTNFGDLFFYFIDFQDSKIIKTKEYVIPSKGVNHRIANLSELMVNKAAKATNSQLLNSKASLEAEYKKHFKVAALELNNFYYSELDVLVTLSDHNSCRVRIDERDLEKRDRPSFQLFKVSFDRFINEHSNLTILQKIFLCGDVLNSTTFIDFFSKQYGSNKVVKPYNDFDRILCEGLISFSSQIKSKKSGKSTNNLGYSSDVIQTKPTVVSQKSTTETKNQKSNPNNKIIPKPPKHPKLPTSSKKTTIAKSVKQPPKPPTSPKKVTGAKSVKKPPRPIPPKKVERTKFVTKPPKPAVSSKVKPGPKPPPPPKLAVNSKVKPGSKPPPPPPPIPKNKK